MSFYNYVQIFLQTRSSLLNSTASSGLNRHALSLLESPNDWTFLLQYKCSVMVVYIDSSKAFDIVICEI